MKKTVVNVIAEDEALIPQYATDQSAGADVRAAINDLVTILPGETALIPTGIKTEIPRGYEIQLRPRSGYALKHGLTILNTPATIDADYRGEIQVILINHGKAPFIVEPKMRIAQFVLKQVVQADFTITDCLSETNRGEGRFGHTGMH